MHRPGTAGCLVSFAYSIDKQLQQFRRIWMTYSELPLLDCWSYEPHGKQLSCLCSMQPALSCAPCSLRCLVPTLFRCTMHIGCSPPLKTIPMRIRLLSHFSLRQWPLKEVNRQTRHSMHALAWEGPDTSQDGLEFLQRVQLLIELWQHVTEAFHWWRTRAVRQCF